MEPRLALVDMARDFHARGWMAGTAGNLSARDRDDFLRIRLADDQVLERGRADAKPSAETAIHRAIYRMFPEAQACLHVHSVEACLSVAHLDPQAEVLALPPLEKIKGLGIWEERPQVAMPLFANRLAAPTIAAEIEARFRGTPPQVPALMIHGHGATVWGASMQEAYNRVEIVEFLMRYLAHRR